MRNVPRAGVLVALLTFVADQAMKWLVTGPLHITTLGDTRALTGFFALRFVPNLGVSLGLFQANSHVMRWALVALTAAIAIGVALWMTRERQRADQAALGLVLGGALGNILDRVRLGYVVDYADFHIGDWRPFLVFNVADAAITIGVLLLLARAFLARDKGDAAVEKVNA